MPAPRLRTLGSRAFRRALSYAVAICDLQVAHEAFIDAGAQAEQLELLRGRGVRTAVVDVRPLRAA